MKIGDAFPSKYLKADDLQGRETQVIINSVIVEDIGSDDRKPVIYFRNREKGLVLNKTNSYEISYTYGEETDAWVGKPIIIFPARTQFQGKMVPCLRVRVPPMDGLANTSATENVPPSVQPPTGPDDLDDEIPF